MCEQDNHENLTVRKLTERECMRLMGFKDSEIDSLKNVLTAKGKPMFSKSAIYKFAGNSVVVDCFKHLMTSILDSDQSLASKSPISVGGFFTGIGAHHSACDRIADERGMKFDIKFQCEFDEKTSAAYDYIHGATHNLGDVTTVDNLNEPTHKVDILFWTPPCQDISFAGRGRGNAKGSGTRSSLAFEVPRILASTTHDNLPKYLIMEEVPAMVSKKYLPNFMELMDEIGALGYHSSWKVMNAADYGVAQSRKRLFAVSRLGGEPPEMPRPFPLEKRLKDYLEPEPVADCYYLSEERIKSLIWSNEKEKEASRGYRFESADGEVVAHTVTSRGGGGRRTTSSC